MISHQQEVEARMGGMSEAAAIEGPSDVEDSGELGWDAQRPVESRLVSQQPQKDASLEPFSLK